MTKQADQKISTKSRWVLFAASLLVLALLVALGTWQVERLQWKENLIATINERVVSEPRSFAAIKAQWSEAGDVEYWPVHMEGRFHHDGERHFFATYRGRTGYFIYTPFELDDGRFVLVNRGFVPFEIKDASLRPDGQVQGRQSIVGLARNRLENKPSSLVPDNDIAKNIFYWKDLAAMVETSGVGTLAQYEPFFVDANDAPNPGGLPVGGVTLIDMPNNHLQYAVTWYGLALALAGVLGFWWHRQRKP